MTYVLNFSTLLAAAFASFASARAQDTIDARVDQLDQKVRILERKLELAGDADAAKAR